MTRKVEEILVELGEFSESQSVPLDGVVRKISYSFNPRDEFWYLKIQKGVVVLMRGIRIVSGVNLLDMATHVDLPQGRLFCYDKELKTEFGRDPSRDNFGKEIILVYEGI